MKRLFLALIRWYQTSISPHTQPRCRFVPTCSEYARQAIEIHGAGKGLLLALWRFLRCNPFGKFGVDPVPPKHKWR